MTEQTIQHPHSTLTDGRELSARPNIDRLCEIMLGERIPSPILSKDGRLLIPAGAKLTRSRIRAMLSHSSVYLAKGFESAEARINEILGS
jgi:hypothetical protein